MGSHLMPYSVSPRRLDQAVGPKPTIHWVTFTSNRRAGTRCPISWKPIDTSRPNRNSAAPRTQTIDGSSPFGSQPTVPRRLPARPPMDQLDGLGDLAYLLGSPVERQRRQRRAHPAPRDRLRPGELAQPVGAVDATEPRVADPAER